MRAKTDELLMTKMTDPDSTYDLVVLLCACVAERIPGGLKYPEDTSTTKLYLGADVRMEAAVRFAERVHTYVVVGGSEQKVTDMRDYLRQEFEYRNVQHQPNIIRLESDPDTQGNLYAVRKWLASGGFAFDIRQPVGLFSNRYHLSRAVRFAADILPQVRFEPLAAEDIISVEVATYCRSAFDRRVAMEAQGIIDWERGAYRDQRQPIQNWKSVCHDPMRPAL